jgi:hypothetical protein
MAAHGLGRICVATFSSSCKGSAALSSILGNTACSYNNSGAPAYWNQCEGWCIGSNVLCHRRRTKRSLMSLNILQLLLLPANYSK